MVGLGEPMLDAILLGDTTEDVREDQARAALELSELHAIVGQHGMDFVGHYADQRLEEAGCHHLGGPAINAGEDQL